MRMERTVRMGNDGQLVYGMEITTYYRKENRSRLKSFQSFFYFYAVPLLSLMYIAASVAFLVFLSKQEKPHMPLRAWIVGIVSGAVATLVLLIWYLVYYIWFSDMLSTYDLEMILDRKTPVTGCDLHAIRLFTRLETLLEWFKFAVMCFRWVWLVFGCVWIWKESSFRTDAPRLFWLSMSLGISSGIECATQLLIFAAGCYYHL